MLRRFSKKLALFSLFLLISTGFALPAVAQTWNGYVQFSPYDMAPVNGPVTMSFQNTNYDGIAPMNTQSVEDALIVYMKVPVYNETNPEYPYWEYPYYNTPAEIPANTIVPSQNYSLVWEANNGVAHIYFDPFLEVSAKYDSSSQSSTNQKRYGILLNSGAEDINGIRQNAGSYSSHDFSTSWAGVNPVLSYSYPNDRMNGHMDNYISMSFNVPVDLNSLQQNFVLHRLTLQFNQVLGQTVEVATIVPGGITIEVMDGTTGTSEMGYTYRFIPDSDFPTDSFFEYEIESGVHRVGDPTAFLANPTFAAFTTGTAVFPQFDVQASSVNNQAFTVDNYALYFEVCGDDYEIRNNLEMITVTGPSLPVLGVTLEPNFEDARAEWSKIISTPTSLTFPATYDFTFVDKYQSNYPVQSRTIIAPFTDFATIIAPVATESAPFGPVKLDGVTFEFSYTDATVIDEVVFNIQRYVNPAMPTVKETVFQRFFDPEPSNIMSVKLGDVFLEPGLYCWNVMLVNKVDQFTFSEDNFFTVKGVELVTADPTFDTSAPMNINGHFSFYFDADFHHDQFMQAAMVNEFDNTTGTFTMPITGTWDIFAQTGTDIWEAHFYPMSTLTPGTTYEVSIATFNDLTDNPVRLSFLGDSSATSGSFTLNTADAVEGDLTYIVASMPNQQQLNVPVDSAFTLYFSDGGAPLEELETKFQLASVATDSSPVGVGGTWNYGAVTTEVVFTPTAPLDGGTSYVMSSGSNIVYLDSPTNSVEMPYLPFESRFTTMASGITVEKYPDMVANPIVNPDTPILFFFSEPVHAASVAAGFTLMDDTQNIIEGTFSFVPVSDPYCTEVAFTPNMSLMEGKCYTASITPGSLKNSNDIPYNVGTEQLVNGFCTAIVSPQIFMAMPYNLMTGTTVELTFTGVNLDKVADLAIVDEYDSMDSNIVVVSPPVVTGASNEMMTMVVHINEQAAVGMKNLNYTDMDNSLSKLPLAFEVTADPIEPCVEIISFENPLPEQQDVYGLGLCVEAPWEVWDKISYVFVKGPNLPAEGFSLNKVYESAQPEFNGVFALPIGVTPEFSSVYTFEMTMNDETVETRTVTANGSLYKDYPTDLAPTNNVVISNFYDNPITFDHVTNPGTPNAYGNSAGVEEIAFDPQNEVDMDYGELILAGEYSTDGKIYNFSRKLKSGIPYNIIVRKPTEENLTYSINGFVIPETAGKKPVVAFHFPEDITVADPAIIVIIPDRLSELGSQQGGIEQYAIFADGLDLNQADTETLIFKNISEQGSDPVALDIPNVPDNLYPNPKMPFEAVRYNIPNLFITPQVTATGTYDSNADLISGFSVIIEKMIIAQGSTEPSFELVGINFFESQYIQHDVYTDKYKVYPYMQNTIEPGTYRYWVAAERLSDGNMAASPAFFSVDAGATVTTIPENGATIVPTSELSLVFSNMMDTYSVEGSFKVMLDPLVAGATPLQGTFSWEVIQPTAGTSTELLQHVMTWIPNNPFPAGQSFNVVAGSVDMPMYSADYKMVPPVWFNFSVQDSSGLLVADTYPGNNFKDVPVQTDVRINFNDNINAADASAAFQFGQIIIDETTGELTSEIPMQGQVIVTDNELRFIPENDLLEGKYYGARVLGTLSGASTEAMGYNYEFIFQTYDSSYVPTQVPYVMMNFPAYNAYNVPLDTNVSIDFSTSMDVLTVIGDQATNQASNIVFSPAIPGTWASLNDATSFVLTPSNNLLPDTKYTVTVRSNVTDTAGTQMGQAFTFEFTSGGSGLVGNVPSVVYHYPSNNDTAVYHLNTIFIDFNKPMNHSATTQAITISPAVEVTYSWIDQNDIAGAMPTTDVAGTAVSQIDTLNITPTNGFAYGTQYTVTIGTGAVDLSDPAVGLPAAYSFKFNTETDTTVANPTIVNYMPQDQMDFVSLDTHVTINFSKTMDQTVTQAAMSVVRVADAIETVIPGEWMWYNTSADFTPYNGFPEGATIKVTVGSGASDTSIPAQTVGTDLIFSFKTLSSGTTAPPVVVSTIPENNGANIPTATYITIAFDKPMNSTATTRSLVFTPPFQADYEWAGTNLVVMPKTKLLSSTLYNIKITTGAQSYDGLGLVSDKSFSFTTSSSTATNPVVLSTLPMNQSNNIPIGAAIEIGFNKVMDQTATDSAITISPALTSYLTMWNYAGVKIIPEPGFEPGTTYTVRISTGARDTSGTSLTQGYSFTFVTATSSYTAPTVVATMPYDGEYNVPLSSSIRISFSEAMNTVVTDDSITMYPDVDGYTWWEGNDIVFQPNTGALQPGMFYTINVPNTAISATGMSMSDSFSFGFQTAQAQIDSKAYVTSVTPMTGMNDVAVNTPVVINFSDAMKPYDTEMAIEISKMTYTTDPMQTTPVMPDPIPGLFTWSNANKTVSFIPQVPFEMGSQYNIDVKDTAMTELGSFTNPYFSSFFTKYDTSTDQTIVTYTMPMNGDAMVPVEAPVIIGFNKAPADQAFVTTSISFTPDVGALSYKWNSDIELEVSHTKSFASETSYIVTLNPDSASSAHVLNFKTSFPTTEGLFVMRTYPESGQRDVALNPYIEIVFSEDMDKPTVASALKFVKLSDNSAVAHTLDWYAPNMVSIKPDATFTPGTTYEVTVGVVAANTSGTTLTAPFNFNFTSRDITDELMVLSTSPRNDEFEVPVLTTTGANTPITIVFNKEMNVASAESAASIMPDVQGSFSWQKETVSTKTIHKMIFKPLKALTKGVSYFVNINGTAKSIDNKMLPMSYGFSFSTEFTNTEKPVVVNTTPLAGMNEIPVTADIGIMFNMPMDDTSVESALLITPALVGTTYVWTADKRGVQIKHSTDFNAGANYNVVIRTTAKSSETTPQYIEAYSFGFTTASEGGLTPKVIHTWPDNQSIGQPLFTSIDFEFNKEMNSEIDPSTLLTISPEVVYDSSWGPMGNIISIFPEKLLAETTYTVTLSKDVADKAKTTMAADKVISFTTVKSATAPSVISSVPANNAVDVPLNQKLIVNFSQYIDPSASEQTITLLPEPTGGYWKEWWGTTLMISANEAFTASTTYTLNVGTQTDTPSNFDGVKMVAPVIVTFTTGTIANGNPMVTVTEPGDGMSNVAGDIYLSVNFSEQLDEASIKGALTITPELQGEMFSYDGFGFGYQAKGLPGQTYTVALSNAAYRVGTTGTDAADKLLPYSFSFTTEAAAETAAPVIQATIPSSDTVDVSLRAGITVAFSTPMNTTKFESAFTVTPETDGQFEWLENMVTFIPSQTLKSSTNYSVQIAKTAESVDGKPLAETYVFSFKTKGLTGAPQIISVLPTAGFTSVPGSTELTATFNMPMEAFATTKAFKVQPDVTGSLVWRDERTMVFLPTANLASGTRYTASIDTSAMGVNGQFMGATYEWQFTTSLTESNAPSVVFSDPFDKADSVGLKKNIVVKFSKEMKQIDTAKSFLILPPVTGAITWLSAKEMVFTPSGSYAKDSDYWVNIGTTATSRIGETLASPYVFGFSTKIPSSEVVSPIVLSTSPEDHQVDLSTLDPIEVSFNMIMNRTLTENQFEITPEIDGRFSWTETTVEGNSMSNMIFTPAEPLPSGAEVEIKVLGYSTSGVPMEKAFYFEFDTKVEDLTDPFISYIYPKSGDTYVLPGATLEIGFSESMDSTTAAGNIELTYIDESGNSVALAPVLTFMYENTSLAVKTADPLTAGRSYRMQIKSGLKDLNGNNLMRDHTVVFTVIDETLNLTAGNQVWKKTLEGSLNAPAMMTLGFAVITNDAGKAFCLNPDGTKLWEAAVAGSPSINNPASILPGDDPVLFSSDSIIYSIDKTTGVIEEGLNLNTGTNWSGPITRDDDGTLLAILNSADQMKIMSILPGDSQPVIKWQIIDSGFNAHSSVAVTSRGTYVFTATNINTGIAALFEYTKSGIEIFGTELSETAFIPSAPAVGEKIYVSDMVSKLFEVDNGVVTEIDLNQNLSNLALTAVTAPIIGYNDLVFMGGTVATTGGVVVFNPAENDVVVDEVTAPVTIEPMVLTTGLVYAAGTTVNYKPSADPNLNDPAGDPTLNQPPAGGDLTPPSGDPNLNQPPTDEWSYEFGETVTGLTVTNNGQILAVGSAGTVAAIAGVPDSSLGTTTWPKVYGALQNVGVSADSSDEFIKSAVSETTPFQAKVGTTVNFNAYASVTYSTSDINEVTNSADDFTIFDDITNSATNMVSETFIDTIVVQLPTYLTDINFTGITNLFGDELEATNEVKQNLFEITVKLAEPIYDSPAVQFRGVNIAFTAKTPVSVPATLDNKIKIIMGSSMSGDFVMALEGDGDAGGTVMRNSNEFEVVSSANATTAVVSNALLELQPQMLASNAGNKDATGKVLPYERLATHILIPSTATVNPKGINLINIVMPSGLVASGVSVTKNGEILKKTTQYLTNYTAGDPIYNVYLVNAVRQSDIGTKGLKLKLEFTISTPDTIWMTPVNAALGFVNDFDKYLGKTATKSTFVMLPPVTCSSGNADGTAGNGDGNMVLIQPKNTAPQARNLTPIVDKTVGDRFKIEWESADPDSLVEYRLFYSTDDALDLTTGTNNVAKPISLFPIFDFNNLSAFDPAQKLSYIWNVTEKDALGEYLVPAGRYTIYALAEDGINPAVQIKSAGKIIVERTNSNNTPEFVFTNLATSDVQADTSADINFTVADADGDAVEYELYFYPVIDVLRAMECYDVSGNFITSSVATDGTAPTSSTAVWSTNEVPAGSYYVLAWYSDGKSDGNIKWSDKAVVITHASANDNLPAQLEWVQPAVTADFATPTDEKLVLEYKALDTDDADATVSLYYNTVQAENKDLKLIKSDLAVADSGTSLAVVAGIKHEWDTSKLANGFYYLLAKVSANRVVNGSPVPTPALRFWCEVPVLIDKAQESGLGEVSEANLTHNSVTIKFRSKLPTTGLVKYGVNGMLTSSAKDTARFTRNHIVILENLTPGTVYYYSVEATGSTATYTLNNNGEFYSFKTLAAQLSSSVDHWMGGNVGKPNALVTLYLEQAVPATTKPGILAAPELSSPIVVRTDASGNWSANIGTAVSASGQAITPTSNDTVKLEVRTDDGKVSIPDAQPLTGIGAHTSSNTAVSTATGTLSSVMSYKISLTPGFNLVALPVSPSTTMTARDFLILVGNSGLALYHYDAGSAAYKSVIRTSDGSDKAVNFLGDALELDMVKGFFVKMKEAKEITISGLKLEKPQPLSLKKGFNMLTVGYGKNFPFSVKTGTTAKAFLKQLGNDGLAIYSYDGSTYKSMLRTADGTLDSSFLGTDFDLITGQAYFFKMKNAVGIIPGE